MFCIVLPATPRPIAAALSRPAFFAVSANFDAAASDTMPISTIAALPAASFGTSDPNAPTPRSAAADTAASAVAVACSGAGSSATADTAPSMVWTRPRSAVFAPDPPWISAVSIAPPRRSRSPLRLSVSAAACSAAKPESFTALVHSWTAAAPPWYSTVAAVICSLPKIRPSAALRSSSVSAPSLFFICSATVAMPTNFPWASYSDSPSASICFFAIAEGLVSDRSIPRNDVPACSPMMPLDANSAMMPVVSSIDTPRDFATGPTNFIACATSSADPCALPAAAANRSATCGRSLPASPNWFMAVAAISAARPTSS